MCNILQHINIIFTFTKGICVVVINGIFVFKIFYNMNLPTTKRQKIDIVSTFGRQIQPRSATLGCGFKESKEGLSRRGKG